MEVKLQKWGNSNGIRIPSTILKDLKIKTNDRLILSQEDDKIIVSKPKKYPFILEEEFEAFNEESPNDDFEWDEPRGKEIW